MRSVSRKKWKEYVIESLYDHIIAGNRISWFRIFGHEESSGRYLKILSPQPTNNEDFFTIEDPICNDFLLGLNFTAQLSSAQTMEHPKSLGKREA